MSRFLCPSNCCECARSPVSLAVLARMSRVTQQNSALVEESAPATQSLANQACVLSDTVSAFRLAMA